MPIYEKVINPKDLADIQALLNFKNADNYRSNEIPLYSPCLTSNIKEIESNKKTML